MKERVAVLDADIFVFKVASAAMREIMFDEYVVSIGDSAEAKVALDNWFEHVKLKLNADRYILAFTGKKNFRYDIWPEYKSNRKDQKKPYLIKELMNYCMNNPRYNCVLKDNLEADDVVGMYMTMPSKSCIYIGVSEDKDLLGVPGWIFNPQKDALAHKTEFGDAVAFFYTQVLTGDSADGYKGVPGVGPVKAAKYIQKAREESEGDWQFIAKGWDTIVKVYEKAGMEYCDAVQNASMAKILWYGTKPLPFHFETIQQYWSKRYGK